MHVVATAGHVDHGKSSLVEALTGRHPDRLEEERRRGLTIQLGYAWTDLDGLGEVAFVDVPGHERFVATMLSGIGPTSAVLLVVAADDPWMPQAAEHLAAIDALGIQHGVVAVTRCDLADPGPATQRAHDELARTCLAGSPVIPVSSRTGAGLDDLRAAVAAMLRRTPSPDPTAPVRLWVDRRFSVRGAGTVITGTLPAGTISRGDVLEYDGRPVRVRGIESLEQPVDTVHGPARVALNLVGDDVATLDRGTPLVTAGAWHDSEVVDVRLHGGRASSPPERPMLHIGATSLAAHCRALGADTVRLTLDRALPLHVGDRALLRDPGSRAVWGVQVLDPMPPPLRRRGAAVERAAQLDEVSGAPCLSSEVERREVVRLSTLRRIGVPTERGDLDVVVAGDWLMSPDRAVRTGRDLQDAVRAHAEATPLDPGLSLTALAERLGLPDPALVAAVVRPPLALSGGKVHHEDAATSRLPAPVEAALAAVESELREAPFSAPTADRLDELGLSGTAVAAAAKAGRLLRLTPGIVLMPGADRVAARLLAELPQPFSTSEARVHLATTRRVALPLLEHLDRVGLTRRHADDTRTCPPE